MPGLLFRVPVRTAGYSGSEICSGAQAGCIMLPHQHVDCVQGPIPCSTPDDSWTRIPAHWGAGQAFKAAFTQSAC